MIPPEYRAGYSEKIAYLPDSYLMYDVPSSEGQSFTRAEHGLPETGFVFCCFNNNFKITPSVFDIWMRLLGRVPGSVLWLLAANETSRNNLRAEAERRDVAADRLVFAPRLPLSDHLMRYRCADLSLDTEFYNGHTTTLDSLWAGTPVITCPGKAFASRVAASALLAAGLPDFVVSSWEAYEALAVDLATRPDRLREARDTLSSGAKGCSLFDNRRYARGLEAAYSETPPGRGAGGYSRVGLRGRLDPEARIPKGSRRRGASWSGQRPAVPRTATESRQTPSARRRRVCGPTAS